MTKRFENKRVVVTGGGGGLGQALALGFAREGAELVLLDINEKGLADTTKQLASMGAKAVTHTIDLSDEGAIHIFAGEFHLRHKQLDVLINNAGLAYGEISQSFETLSMDRWLRFLAINMVSPLVLAQALRPALARTRGVVLNQSCMASFVPASAYGVTKAALNSMTYGMAQVFGPDDIWVNAVAPGLMETEANLSGLSSETHARIRGMQLVDLRGAPDDIVALHLFLVSDDARFITCEVVRCDGGNRLRGWRN
ncbi:SDR family NAD(P)-dependent oxidoreductase [Agrobacterium tumefaciens]|uniref:SDR family NAD(P)-dependent oxidoreductase n=1 Tax=Agrobacterium tumefaciens TaxID=358 RepID=UPI0012B96076|nr:SDR family oxidoreductase [Agrobacterium tumefaciens]MQB07332.1 SDR family NAD(P)-dependent oxidoreductase [Agrobacterium tumefaciens]